MGKCPGQDKAYWTPDDILDMECPSCHEYVEFFKTDVTRKCSCGEIVLNDRLDLKCAMWCSAASICIGLDYPLKKYDDKNNKKRDFERLTGIVEEESIRDRIHQIYDDDNLDSLLDIKKLYVIKLKEEVVYNKIVGYLRQLANEKK